MVAHVLLARRERAARRCGHRGGRRCAGGGRALLEPAGEPADAGLLPHAGNGGDCNRGRQRRARRSGARRAPDGARSVRDPGRARGLCRGVDRRARARCGLHVPAELLGAERRGGAGRPRARVLHPERGHDRDDGLRLPPQEAGIDRRGVGRHRRSRYTGRCLPGSQSSRSCSRTGWPPARVRA